MNDCVRDLVAVHVKINVCDVMTLVVAGVSLPRVSSESMAQLECLVTNDIYVCINRGKVDLVALRSGSNYPPAAEIKDGVDSGTR